MDVRYEDEVERKFSCADPSRLPPVGVGDWSAPLRLELCAEYYDTATLDLTRAGWSLRRRSGGYDAGWHLKGPRLGDRRLEHRVDSSDGGPPPGLLSIVADVLADRPVRVVATIVTVRDEFDLLDPSGSIRAHLCVDAVRTTAGDEQNQWTEVEVELASGEPLLTLELLTSALADVGCIRAEHTSKVAKALSQLRPHLRTD